VQLAAVPVPTLATAALVLTAAIGAVHTAAGAASAPAAAAQAAVENRTGRHAAMRRRIARRWERAKDKGNLARRGKTPLSAMHAPKSVAECAGM
jgi:hypothetical protein